MIGNVLATSCAVSCWKRSVLVSSDAGRMMKRWRRWRWSRKARADWMASEGAVACLLRRLAAVDAGDAWLGCAGLVLTGWRWRGARCALFVAFVGGMRVLPAGRFSESGSVLS